MLHNEAFHPSENGYDWLGSGIYFWESNPDRALEWAESQRFGHPFVVGAVIDPGFCLDLASSNGTKTLIDGYALYQTTMKVSGGEIPTNSGGQDYLHRKLDCAVINFVHSSRQENDKASFDTVRGVFMEGDRLYPTSGFRRQTHIQICVRNPAVIKGVFRVRDDHFSSV